MLPQCILLAAGLAAAAPQVSKAPLLAPNATAAGGSDAPSPTEVTGSPSSRPATMWDVLDLCQDYLPQWDSHVSKTCSALDEDGTSFADSLRLGSKCLVMGIDQFAMTECTGDEGCARNRLLLELNSFKDGLQKCKVVMSSRNQPEDSTDAHQSSSAAGPATPHVTVDLTAQLVNKNTSVSRDLVHEAQPQPLAMQTCLGGCNMGDTDCQTPCLDPQFAHAIHQVAAVMGRPGSQAGLVPASANGTPLTPVATLLTGPPSATYPTVPILVGPQETKQSNDDDDQQSPAAMFGLSSSVSTVAVGLSLIAFLL